MTLQEKQEYIQDKAIQNTLRNLNYNIKYWEDYIFKLEKNEKNENNRVLYYKSKQAKFDYCKLRLTKAKNDLKSFKDSIVEYLI